MRRVAVPLLLFAILVLGPGSLLAQRGGGGGGGRPGEAGGGMKAFPKKGPGHQKGMGSQGMRNSQGGSLESIVQQVVALVSTLLNQLQAIQVNPAAVRDVAADLRKLQSLARTADLSGPQGQAQAGQIMRKTAFDLDRLGTTGKLPAPARLLLGGAARAAQDLAQKAPPVENR